MSRVTTSLLPTKESPSEGLKTKQLTLYTSLTTFPKQCSPPLSLYSGDHVTLLGNILLVPKDSPYKQIETPYIKLRKRCFVRNNFITKEEFLSKTVCLDMGTTQSNRRESYPPFGTLKSKSKSRSQRQNEKKKENSVRMKQRVRPPVTH